MKMTYSEISKKHFNDWVSSGLALWPHHVKKRERLENSFSRILESSKETAFICKDIDGEPVGFINASARTDYVEGSTARPVGYVEGIYVKPGYRRRGIAKMLVKQAEKWALKNGCAEMGSDTGLKNAQSRKFHIKAGFKETEKIIHFIKKIKQEAQ